MNEPSVLCVMLADGRPGMVRQAVACFRAQTYQPKKILIYDTGDRLIPGDSHFLPPRPWYTRIYDGRHRGKTIGELRNLANGVEDYGDIIIHWDSDDWSHPRRIGDQVEMLQETGAECVGYNSMLFWKEEPGEAWEYHNSDPRYCLGTSLCYWRSVWEKRPFEPTSQGEDARWLMGVKSVGVSSGTEHPLMIARIHPGNTSNAYAPETMRRASEWRRAPEWDDYCREKMALA